MILFYLGFIFGANISLILYACIIVGKDADKNIYIDLDKEVKSE